MGKTTGDLVSEWLDDCFGEVVAELGGAIAMTFAIKFAGNWTDSKLVPCKLEAVIQNGNELTAKCYAIYTVNDFAGLFFWVSLVASVLLALHFGLSASDYVSQRKSRPTIQRSTRDSAEPGDDSGWDGVFGAGERPRKLDDTLHDGDVPPYVDDQAEIRRRYDRLLRMVKRPSDEKD